MTKYFLTVNLNGKNTNYSIKKLAEDRKRHFPQRIHTDEK